MSMQTHIHTHTSAYAQVHIVRGALHAWQALGHDQSQTIKTIKTIKTINLFRGVLRAWLAHFRRKHWAARRLVGFSIRQIRLSLACSLLAWWGSAQQERRRSQRP